MSKQNLGIKPDFAQKVRVLRAQLGLNQSEFARLMGFSKNSVGAVEKGGAPSPRFIQQLEMLERDDAERRLDKKSNGQSLALDRDIHLDEPDIVPLRLIPLISWAKAGEATDYEEMPPSWQKLVPAPALDDPKAFAISIAGDSMEPRYQDGDVAFLSPSTPFRQNGLVIARLDDEAVQGVVFKLCSRSGDVFRFSSFNPAYAPFEVHARNVKRIFTVHSVLKIVK